ncbi:uncharacterized protein LOC105664695 [Ceratitis capitata]|uniref:uncharacterized protein LOC105664695 n=1 Tax=Ceratitis capitata TaxID=7213 RepID=UPI0006188577|nr:uncharacterized protein LOC105664695 [Ceratitis capitata]
MHFIRTLLIFLLFVFVIGVYALPPEINTLTFSGVCEEKGGDWCSLKCQIAGGRDGYCNKVKICYCRQM